MNNHRWFIESEIEELLRDAVYASRSVANGIGSFAVCDYILQSLFLRMTGYSEQKAKCICWELATDDYEYRYDYLKSISNYGEMLNPKSKNRVLNDLLKIIRKIRPDFNPENAIDKKKILGDVKDSITEIFSSSLLMHNNPRHWAEFIESYDRLFVERFVLKGKEENYALLEGDLKDAYEVLYKHRNRCAHNLSSYQQNLPSLKIISDKKYQYENYYVRFALLLTMDKIFVLLYKMIYH